MNTALTPPPTDREREMLAEWAGRFATMQDGNTTLKYHPEIAVVKAEALLHEFRDRYGVTGAEVEAIGEDDRRLKPGNRPERSDFDYGPERKDLAMHQYAQSLVEHYENTQPAPIRDPQDITLKDAIKMLHPDKTLTIYDSDCMGVIRHDSGVGEWEFNDLPELIAILKGGNNETR